MGKFAFECPNCGTINKASTFIFADKKITCGKCGQVTDVRKKENRIAIGFCPECGQIAFDQAKAKCPVCGKPIQSHHKANSIDDLKKSGNTTPIFQCPECGCHIQAYKTAEGKKTQLVCPVCDHIFDGYEDVFSQIQKSKLVNNTGVSVIKYEGDNDTFIWKHPIEDFNLGSQLIVHESQEAIFFLDGQALDIFGSGRYTLETENLPILKRIQDLPTGRQNPFHAEVYFINKTVQMSIPWGTSERIRFIEPNTGAPITIGASGELNLQVSDGKKLLLKLVGTTSGIKWGDKNGFEKEPFSHTLRSYFKPFIQTIIKSNLASIIKQDNIDILEIDERLDSLSVSLREKISIGFEEYGLFVPQFYVTSISLPDKTDPNFQIIKKLRAESLRIRDEEYEANIVAARRKRVLEQETTRTEQSKYEAERKRIEAQGEADADKLRGFAEAEVMRAKGFTQKDVLQADVQKAYAEGIGNMGGNGGGGTMSDVLGLGVGLAAAGSMGQQFNEAIKGFSQPTDATVNDNAAKPESWICSCGCSNTGKFCSECGKSKPELWDCQVCGNKGNVGNFCSECGRPKPELWDCQYCGAKGNKGKFCSECGKSRTSEETWDCSCGNKNISGKFCPECGKAKEDLKNE